MRFGIIGCAKAAGKIGRAINLAPNSVLHAVGDPSLETAKQFVAANGAPDTVKIYGSYDQVVADPCVDVVYVASPPSVRGHWALLAAKNKKHLLVEKPTALNLEELDEILGECESNGVQFMDGTIWFYHPRTAKIKNMLLDSHCLGDIDHIYSTLTTSIPPAFLDKLNADTFGSLGTVGELGWHCVAAVLWIKNHELPTSATALPDVTKNSHGLIMSCTASLHFDHAHKTSATIHFSFLSHLSTELTVIGSKGSLYVKDYIIPFVEDSACFEFTIGAKFVDLHVGWNVKPEKVVVACGLPQEASMVQKLANLVNGIRGLGLPPDKRCGEICRKTQLVLDAIKKSVDIGCKTVYL